MNRAGEVFIIFISGEASRFGVVRGGSALGTTLTDSFDSTASLRAVSNGLDSDGDGTLDVFILQAGASLNVGPITLMPFSSSAAPASIFF